MPNSPKEAPSEFRVFAAVARNMFLALVEEGFTEAQALQILGVFIAAQLGQQQTSG